MNPRLLLPAALAVAVPAGLGVLGVGSAPLRLKPGSAGFTRIVLGATPEGLLRERALVRLPGLDRGGVVELLIGAEATAAGAAAIGVSVDRGPWQWLRLRDQAPALVAVPPARAPGLRVDLRLPDSARGPIRLRSLEVRRGSPLPWTAALVAFGLTAALAAVLLARLPGGLALALGLWCGALLALAATPLLLLWTLASPGSWWRLAGPLALLAGSVVVAARSAELRRFGFGAALVAAAVFGGFVRLYFLPSSGSWDVQYWKACALRSASHGVTRVYGDPGSVPPGHFLAQLRGQEPQRQLEALDQSFVVDQPPGIQALWAASWWAVGRARHGLEWDEALNVAAKLPATLGDLLAAGLLLLAFRERLRFGALLAALYWALPISWLSSGVLGFFDGAPAVAALAALLMAGRGRAGWAGALLALAALLKVTALLVAPAVLVALWVGRAPLARALAAGSAVVVLALVPFALDGTLTAAVVHVYRIIFQERLSGGFANAWWLLGALTEVRAGSMGWTDRVPFVRIEVLPFPARPVGAAAMGLLVAGVAWLQRRSPGPRAAALAGFVLVFGYASLAVGVHENHPHMMVLLALASGLPWPRLRLIAATALTTYVLNMLALSGLGRFYGPRYMALQPLVEAVAGLRLGLGFDLTLLLALINLAAFAALLRGLPAAFAASAEGAALGGAGPSPPD